MPPPKVTAKPAAKAAAAIAAIAKAAAASSSTATRRDPMNNAARGTVTFAKPEATAGYRTIIYGPGGIGKTTFAANAPGKTVFFDLDESLGRLRKNHDVEIVPVETWDDMREALQATGWDGVDNIVVDTGTKAEELAVAWTLKNVPHEKNNIIKRIEDYGFGKGYQHVYDTFLALLGDLDIHARSGRNVVVTCHDCTTMVPNPHGEDYLRYEPRLQSPTSGKGSIRLRIREWADHLLFIGYDVVAKDKKATGSGTRTIYPVEQAHCMAKSRTLSADDIQEVTLENMEEIWGKILNRE